MKKFISLGVVLLGCGLALSANSEEKWTTGGNITFTVDVEQPACTVEVGLPQITKGALNLGTIFAEDGSVGARLPLVFRFSGCTNVKSLQSIAYTADVGKWPGSEPGSPGKGFISTKNDRVRLFLYRSITGSDKFISKDFSTSIPSNGAATETACYIEPRIVGGNAQAGDYEAVASFTITYL